MGISMLLFIYLAIFVPKLVHCDESEDVHWTTKASTTKASTTKASTTKAQTTTTIGQETTNLCENPSSVIFPVCATYNANLSLADPNYLSEITWFYKVASLRGACFFKHNLYRCPLPENQTITVTTTTTEPTTTSTTTKPVSTGPCDLRLTGVNITGVGKLIVNNVKRNFNDSVAFCQNISAGCELWAPLGNSTNTISKIGSYMMPCDQPPLSYFIGVVQTSPGTYQTLNGTSWDFFSVQDSINPDSGTFPYLTLSFFNYQYASPTSTGNPICLCSS